MDVIHRENFSLGPISIDTIEKNLYLGGLTAAKDLETLNKYKITHIITIDTCPLPRKIMELKHITIKYIHLSDNPKEDLLSHFDETFIFIKEGLSKGSVLVHCYFGVSRSATVVIAYIMKKHQLTFHEAFQKVKAKRNIVHPNQGFVSQLNLYKEMGYTIIPKDMHFKMYKLTVAADKVRKVKILPQNFHDLIQPGPNLAQIQPEPKVYRCKKCRHVLASESNSLIHQDKGANCIKIYFLEPMAWMHVTEATSGKLHCPECLEKLGSFNWITGCQCPCGIQIAPAFYLTPSKINYCC